MYAYSSGVEVRFVLDDYASIFLYYFSFGFIFFELEV